MDTRSWTQPDEPRGRAAVATSPITNGTAIFLSPHYDDVVLSCGGLVSGLVEARREPLMVTIFGGETPEELVGDFARWKHSRWGYATADDVLSVRRSEDAAAAEVLGCRTRWLGYFDAIYRGDRYGKDGELFGQLQEIEAGLVPLIAEEVLNLPEREPDSAVYVPLGVGGHVDHQLTFAAGQLLAAQGVPVFAYEDCPYAIHTPAGVDRRLEVLGAEVGAPLIVPIGAMLERRIAAIAAYTTQVPVIFRFTDDMPGVVAAHAARVGGEQGAAERYWPVHGKAI